jgi:hypothetical protein
MGGLVLALFKQPKELKVEVPGKGFFLNFLIIKLNHD